MSLLLASEVIVAVIVLLWTSLRLYMIYLRKYSYWVGKNIPSTKNYPIAGSSGELPKGTGIYEVDLKLCQKYGKLFGGYIGGAPVLYVADPDLLKLILVKDFATFSSKRPFSSGEDLLDNSLASIKGDDRWRHLRNTMSPTFSSGKLKNMIPIISDCSKNSKSNFEKYAISEECVDAKKLYGNYTLDVIANVAFGTKLDSHNDPNNKFVHYASKIFNMDITFKHFLIFTFPKISKFLGYTFFPKECFQFFKEVTNNIMERRLKTNEVRHDFLQLMMDCMKADNEHVEDKTNVDVDVHAPIRKVEQIKRITLTKDDVLSQCVTFFAGGYDTTATTLSMASYYLACNPDKQQKVLDEVDRIWEKRFVRTLFDGSRPLMSNTLIGFLTMKTTLDAEAVFEAKYIEAVIDETLRLSPPIFKIARLAQKDYELGDTGVTIPKGMIVEIPVLAIHHDPDFYPNPEEFRPERFLPKENNEVMPYTYLPFSSGPRNCIALRLAHLQIKICLLHILKDLKFATCPQTTIPIEYMKRTGLLHPKDVILSVLKRN